MKMVSHKQQFLKNVGSGWLAQTSAAIVGFIMLPYNLSHLGNEVYGISVLAVSAIAMLEFLSLGMKQALLRFFSQAITKNDKVELAFLSSTSQLILGGLGLLGCFLILAAIPWFLHLYGIVPAHRHETAILLICLAITFFQRFHTMVFANILMASHRFDLVNFNSILASWLRLALLIFFYTIFNSSLIELGLATILANTFNYLTTILLSLKQHGKIILFSPRKVTTSCLPSLFSFSALTMVDTVFYAASIQLPVMITGKTLGKEMAAFFSPAVLVVYYFTSLMAQMANPLAPLASRDLLENHGKNIGHWATLFGQLIAAIGYGCIFVSVLFMPDILRLWLGSGFIWTSATVTILLTGIVYEQIQAVNYNLALGASTIAPFAYSSVMMAILISFGTLLGTMYWHWGLLEVAVYITTVRILRNMFFLAAIYSRLFHYSFADYFSKVYIRPTFSSCILFVAILLCQPWFAADMPPGFVLLGVKIIGVGSLYFGMTWICSLSGETKALFFKEKNHH